MQNLSHKIGPYKGCLIFIVHLCTAGLSVMIYYQITHNKRVSKLNKSLLNSPNNS